MMNDIGLLQAAYFAAALALTGCNSLALESEPERLKSETCDPKKGLAGVELNDSFNIEIESNTATCKAGEAWSRSIARCKSVEGKWIGAVDKDNEFQVTITAESTTFATSLKSCVDYGMGHSCSNPAFTGELPSPGRLRGAFRSTLVGPDSFDNGMMIPHSYISRLSFDGQHSADALRGTFTSTNSEKKYDLRLCREGSNCCLTRRLPGIIIKLTGGETEGAFTGAVHISEDSYSERLDRWGGQELYKGAWNRPGTYQVRVTADMQGDTFKYSTVVTVTAECNRCNLIPQERTIKIQAN